MGHEKAHKKLESEKAIGTKRASEEEPA